MSVSEAFRGVVDESVQVNVSQAFNGTTLRSFMPSAAIPDGEVMRRLVQDVDAWAKATKDGRNPVAHGGRMGADVQLLPAITSDRGSCDYSSPTSTPYPEGAVDIRDGRQLHPVAGRPACP